ncbi:MAG: DUF11 domain-containing protein [Anaerolineales bacterium]|nr:DUF11 domain-containing protein [Anaerolineales bacterium]
MQKTQARSRYLAWAFFLATGLLLFVATYGVLAQQEEQVAEILGPNLQVEKTANTDQAEPGETVIYTIVVQNSGDEQVQAWMTDTLPNELTYVNNSLDANLGDFGEDSGVITWTANMFGYGYTAIISFSAVTSSEINGVDVPNTAHVTGNGQIIEDTYELLVQEGPLLTYFPLVFKNYPPIPTLNAIPEPDANNDYTISWTAVEVAFDHYVLQESTVADFSTVSNQWQTTATSKFIDKAGGVAGTFYYRVRADNNAQWGEGPWSNVKSVDFWMYEDDFSNYKSGWPREWSRTRAALYQVHPNENPSCPGSSCEYDDGDGYVLARRAGSDPRARFGPGVKVPSANYQIEVDARWWDAQYNATYQIFFGSNNPFNDADDLAGDYYALQVRINTKGDFCEYSLIEHKETSREPETTTYHINWVREDEINCGQQHRSNTSKAWNNWKIKRDGSNIVIYVNGTKINEKSDSSYGANRYFGVGATVYEGLTPSKPVFDNFKVTLLD